MILSKGSFVIDMNASMHKLNAVNIFSRIPIYEYLLPECERRKISWTRGKSKIGGGRGKDCAVEWDAERGGRWKRGDGRQIGAFEAKKWPGGSASVLPTQCSSNKVDEHDEHKGAPVRCGGATRTRLVHSKFLRLHFHPFGATLTTFSRAER